MSVTGTGGCRPAGKAGIVAAIVGVALLAIGMAAPALGQRDANGGLSAEDLRGMSPEEARERLREGRDGGSRDSPVDAARRDGGDESDLEDGEPSRASRRDRARMPEPSRLTEDYRSRLRSRAGATTGGADARTDGAAAPGDDPAAVGDGSRVARDDAAGPWGDAVAAGDLEQFGYDYIRGGSDDWTTGAVSESYRLGIGDEIVVILRGQRNESFRTEVDRKGQVVLPELEPVPAAGRRFGEFERALEARIDQAFLKTDAFVSLGTLRRFPVTVMGEVDNPGRHQVLGASTVLDALAAAGGVERTGSLRRIRILRDGSAFAVDLYDVLLGGTGKDAPVVQEGDRVMVPTIGPTAAVAGAVNRPAIYELPPGGDGMPAARAIELGGGTLRPRGYRYQRLTAQAAGGDSVRDISLSDGERIADGDILVAVPRSDAVTGSVSVTGNVTAPGARSIETAPNLRALFANRQLLEADSYRPFAVIAGTDPNSGVRTYEAAALNRVLSGETTRPLSPSDHVYVLSLSDVRFLVSDAVQAVLNGRAPDAGQGCRSLRRLSRMRARAGSGRFANAQFLGEAGEEPFAQVSSCPRIFEDHPDLLAFVLDHAVVVQDEVRHPGLYPVTEAATLADLVPAAGGLTPDADLSNVKLTRFAADGGDDVVRHRTIDARRGSLTQTALRRGDVVRFRAEPSARESGTVRLTGEFEHPGRYPIGEGDTIADMIEQAGGLSEQAYPDGAVFTRTRVARQQEDAFERAAREIESATIQLVARSEQGQVPEGLFPAVRQLSERLRNTDPPGRVVIEADPAVLAAKPALDTVVEGGDRLHIPKRPNSVTVSGEVLNPTTLQFRSGRDVADYVEAAGGTTQAADDARTYVVYPNGEARPVQISAWTYETVRVPPGSTVVVPRDARPFDWLRFSGNLTGIFSDLAVSAASLSVIGNN